MQEEGKQGRLEIISIEEYLYKRKRMKEEGKKVQKEREKSRIYIDRELLW